MAINMWHLNKQILLLLLLYMKPEETPYLFYEALLGEYFCIAEWSMIWWNYWLEIRFLALNHDFIFIYITIGKFRCKTISKLNMKVRLHW